MKVVLTITLLFLSLSLWAHDNESDSDERVYLDNSSQLNTWCKNESAEHFLAQDFTPNNWTSSRWVEGDYLFVEGVWKVGADKYKVKCTARKNIAEKYAKWKLVEK